MPYERTGMTLGDQANRRYGILEQREKTRKLMMENEEYQKNAPVRAIQRQADMVKAASEIATTPGTTIKTMLENSRDDLSAVSDERTYQEVRRRQPPEVQAVLPEHYEQGRIHDLMIATPETLQAMAKQSQKDEAAQERVDTQQAGAMKRTTLQQNRQDARTDAQIRAANWRARLKAKTQKELAGDKKDKTSYTTMSQGPAKKMADGFLALNVPNIRLANVGDGDVNRGNGSESNDIISNQIATVAMEMSELDKRSGAAPMSQREYVKEATVNVLETLDVDEDGLAAPGNYTDEELMARRKARINAVAQLAEPGEDVADIIEEMYLAALYMYVQGEDMSFDFSGTTPNASR